jgi:hypothetical protein
LEKKKKKRYYWAQKVKEGNMDYLENDVFIYKSGFTIYIVSKNACSHRGTGAIVISPTSKRVSHSILGTILRYNHFQKKKKGSKK